MDERRTPFGALAQANRAHLRERSNGLRLALAEVFDSSHERRADSAHARQQNSEFPIGGRDFGSLLHDAPFIQRSENIHAKSTFRTRTTAAEVLRVHVSYNNNQRR